MSDIDTKIENAFKDMFNKLDDKYFRKMQVLRLNKNTYCMRDTHLCRAKCCDDMSMNMDAVQRCVDNCSGPIGTSQEFVTRELQSFRDRLVRCSLDCQDSINDKISAKSDSGDILRHKMEYEKCVSSCADKILKLMPNMVKKIEDVAKEHQKHLDKMKL